MSMDVSRLAIEVTSTGIKEASVALGGLSRSAGGADKKVQSLTSNLAKLMQGAGNTTGAVSGLTGTMALINTAMQSAAANAAAMAQALAAMTSGFNALQAAADKSSGSLRKHNDNAGTGVTTLKAMAVAASAYLGFNFVKHSIEMADSWTQMAAKLKLATGSMNNATVAQQDLFDMSQKLRSPLEDSVKLFTRMAPIMRMYGKSYEDTKDVVEGVSLALKLNGATTAESASVMLQFSQAMQKGKLDGQEFNAVASNAGILMRALAEYTGKSQAELATLRSKGFITVEIMQKAIAAALPKWRADFASLPVTVEDAWQRIKNAWLKGMGEISQESGLNAGLAKTLSIFESMIPAVRDELVKAFIAVGTWINQNREGISAVWGQVKGLVGDVFGLIGDVAKLSATWGDNTDGVNVLGFAIFAVRLAIAGVIDGVKVISAVFVEAGGFVADIFLAPLWLAVKVVEKIASGIGWTMDMLAKGASALGMDTISKAFSSAGSSVQSFVDGTKDLEANIKGVGESAHDTATSIVQGMLDGKGAVATLLEGEQAVNATIKERAKLNKSEWDTGGKPPPIPDPKAIKEHEKAVRSANAELNKMLDSYKELASQSDHIDQFGLSWDKLSKSEKDVIVLNDLLARTTDKTAQGILKQAINVAEANAQMERQNGLRIEALKAEEAYSKKQDAGIDAAQKELDQINSKIAAYGKLKDSVDDATLAEARRLMLEQGDTMTDDQVKKQLALIAVLEQVKEKKSELANMELSDKVTKELDALKPADFGSGFGDAFGSLGKSIDKAGKSLDQYNKKMQNLAKIRKDVLNEKDDVKRAKDLETLRSQELKDNLDMYADMAGAVKGFFKEKTTAYKMFDALEKGLRIARLVADAEEFAVKIKNGAAWLAEKISQGFAAMASDTAVTTASVANSEVSAGASVVAGVAKCFEQMGIWGFVGAAAIIAFMASMGVGHGGGGGAAGMTPDQIKADHQKQNGTGTVLGDDTAKSESIKNSLDRLKDNSDIGLVYTSEMLMSLRNIDLKMGGMTAQVARIPGLTTGKNFSGASIGTTTSGIRYLGGSTTTREIADTGLSVNGRLQDLISGGGMKQYLDVLQTKKSSGFLGIGGSTKTSSFRDYQGVDSELASTVGGIFSDISDTIVKAGTQLGLSGDEMQKKLSDFVLKGEVSLKDLKGDDLSKALEAFFSSSADQMAEFTAGAFKSFQKTGEGYFETLTRVATQTETAKDALGKLGVSMISLWDVTNKTADLDVELVRQSLMRQEAGTSLEKIMSLMNGSMDDLIGGYKELTRIRNAMVGMGVNGNNLSLDLIRGAGGINELASAFDNYTDKFYSAQEQAQLKMSQVTLEFNRLGIAAPKSRVEFRNLVTALMQGGADSQEMAGRILSLSSDFSDAMDAYDSSTGTQITDARQALSDAYDRESTALQNTRDKMQGFSDSLKQFKDNLIQGDLSPLSTMEKYQNALAKYDDVSTRAMAGDETAISQFQSVAEDLLKYSRDVNASGGAYMTDFNRVIAATDALQQYTQGQADSATTQLDLLQKQVDGLIEVNTSVLTVAQAIVDLIAVMGGTASAAVTSALTTDTAMPTGTDTTAAPLTTATPTAETNAAQTAATTAQSNASLISEIQGLRSEVVALRQEAKANAGDVVTATYDANDKAAVRNRDRVQRRTTVGSLLPSD
jgi:tape measure domain-containing protein